MSSSAAVTNRPEWAKVSRALNFGLRNWLAMMLALLVAFWLQLDSASSAAVCVGILALPTRGQVLQKALYRVLGTAIGVAASFVIAGLFNEVRDLFIVAFAAWLGLCVFAAGLLDGNRAYGAVLSGYTVAIVAVTQIDAPQNVFDSGVNRAAAIVVGIGAIMVVNDMLAAPDVLPGLISKLEALRGKIRTITDQSLRGETVEPGQVAALYAEIAALHPDITALPTERLRGRERAAGARIAVVSMIEQVMAARVTASLPIGGTSEPQRRAAELARFRLSRLAETLDAAIERMRSGTAGPAGPSLPIYRAPQEAARTGLRTFLAVLLAAAALSVAGWPQASLGLAFIGATLGIGGTNAKPRDFAFLAMIAMPGAVLLAGVTEFVVLDGADGFPALALAMAPPVIGASMLLTTGRPALVGLGFLVIVFFPVLLSPSNPQSYDPQSFLDTSILALTAVIGVFVLLSTLLPVTDAMRGEWLLRSARTGSGNVHRDATRVAQLGALRPAEPDRVSEALRWMELAAMRRHLGQLGLEAPHAATATDLLLAAARSAAWDERHAEEVAG